MQGSIEIITALLNLRSTENSQGINYDVFKLCATMFYSKNSLKLRHQQVIIYTKIFRFSLSSSPLYQDTGKVAVYTLLTKQLVLLDIPVLSFYPFIT